MSGPIHSDTARIDCARKLGSSIMDPLVTINAVLRPGWNRSCWRAITLSSA